MPDETSLERRVDDLLSRMTLEEKVGQMHQARHLPDTDAEAVRKGLVGSVLCSSSAWGGNEKQERILATQIDALQKIAVEESRLGIPMLFGRDVIHGHRTVAPIPLGQAAAWDPDLVRENAACAAREARADGINWTFTPMLDIARDPRWGRVAEGFGEDPYLCSALARAAVEGYQGDFGPENVLACMKHFAGYGAVEGGRDYDTTEISLNTMRNVYLPPFHAAVEAGVGSAMACFNENGGIPATANATLLTQILRDEWGFDGLVVSDWGAVAELIEHGVAADLAHAARLAASAGVDIDMASDAFITHLPALCRSNAIPEDVVDNAVRRILRIKFRMGLFERPYSQGAAADVHGRADHRESAQRLAERSLVLLANRALPLGAEGRVLVYGPLAKAREALFGTWTLDGDETSVVPILDAMRSLAPERVHAVERIDEALSGARWCDVVVAVMGESPARSGEDNSLTTLDLPPGQLEELQALKRIGKPLIVVVVAGRPLSIPWVLENADAVLWAFHPGSMGGIAIANALYGRVNPSGKLPVTLPRSVGQVPIYYNHKRTGRPLPPGSQRTRYIDEQDSPLRPFGFGLSYTAFEYKDLKIAPVGEGVFEVRATVANTGAVAGDEVVQLYIRDHFSERTRPVKELKGFRRVSLSPGESAEIEFSLDPKELGYFGPADTWCVEPGRFTVWVGPNSEEGLEGQLELGPPA